MRHSDTLHEFTHLGLPPHASAKTSQLVDSPADPFPADLDWTRLTYSHVESIMRHTRCVYSDLERTNNL